MNSLIKMVLKFKMNNSEEYFKSIVLLLNDKMNFYLINIESYVLDDLKQEIMNKLYKVLCNFKIREINLQYDVFISEINKIKLNHKSSINSVNNFYLHNRNIINDIYDFNNLYYEYKLYCNENQLRKYINKICENTRIDYYRKIEKEKEIIFSHNFSIFECGNTNNLHSINIKSKDMEFIELFYHKNRRLKDIEVSKMLGVSKQAVSKRKKRIENKYNIKI